MKRILAVLMLLALLPSAMGETYVVDYSETEESPGYALLIKSDGTALTPPETYSSLRMLTPEGTPESERLYSAEQFRKDLNVNIDAMNEEEYNRYYVRALVNGDGAQLTGFEYDDLTWDNGVVIAQRYEGDTDVLDASGKVQFTGAYTDVHPTGNGGWLALKREDDERYAVVMVDADGRVRDTGLHTDWSETEGYVGGHCIVQDVEEYDGCAALLDAEGRVTRLDFSYASELCGNYAVVSQEEYYGVYDLRGELLLPIEYDYINLDTAYTRPLFIAQKKDIIDIYDAETGGELLSRRFKGADYVYTLRCADDLLAMFGGDTQLLCDLNGNTLLKLPADREISYYYTDCQGRPGRLVETSGDWPDTQAHLIDLHGQTVGSDYFQLYAQLWKDGHGRFVASQTQVVQSSEGYRYPAWRSYRSGVIDENGEELLPVAYLNLNVLDLDRYWVETPDRAGLIDGAGKWYYAIEKYEMLMD